MHVHMQHTQRFGSFFMYFLLTFLVDFLWPVEIEKINEFFFLTELRKMHFSDEGRCAYPGALAINFWCFKNYLQHTFGMHVVTVWTGHLVVKSSSFRFCAICRVCKWLEKLRREREIERERNKMNEFAVETASFSISRTIKIFRADALHWFLKCARGGGNWKKNWNYRAVKWDESCVKLQTPKFIRRSNGIVKQNTINACESHFERSLRYLLLSIFFFSPKIYLFIFLLHHFCSPFIVRAVVHFNLIFKRPIR